MRAPPRRPDVEQELEGTVEAIVPGGKGLVRAADGIVLVKGGLPGERVRVAIERRQKNVRHGVVLRVLEASPDRVASDCALHGLASGRCGGCDLLELRPEATRAVKERIVDDALLRVGRIDRAIVEAARRPIVAPGPGEDGSRRRARFVMKGGAPTFSSWESHARVPIERCPALHPALERALPLLARARLEDGTGLKLACDDRGHVSACIEGGRRGDAKTLVDAGAAHGAIVLAGDGDENERERAGDAELAGEITAGLFPCASDAGVFTQATRFGGRAIVDEVMRAALVAPGTRVLELFAGAGHLTVPLLEAGAVVDAVEGAPRSVRFLRHNTTAHAGKVSARVAFIDDGLALGEHAPLVVADPPRTGIPGFGALLARARPDRLVLVSCDPATGARDLAHALAAGYRLESLVPIDAFPRTSHVEWVAALAR